MRHDRRRDAAPLPRGQWNRATEEETTRPWLTVIRFRCLETPHAGTDTPVVALSLAGIITSPSTPSARAMRRASAIPNADTVVGLAASTGLPGRCGSACRRTAHMRQAPPSKPIESLRHKRSGKVPGSTASRVGSIASRQSHARKSLSGSRQMRQQHCPRWSKNRRLSRGPSLHTPTRDSAYAACDHPDSSPPHWARYRHSTVPSAASCRGCGNRAETGSLRTSATLPGFLHPDMVTSPPIRWPRRCAPVPCSGPALCCCPTHRWAGWPFPSTCGPPD